MRYQGKYKINWLNKGVKEVYIQDKLNDIPCFERFVYIWDVETDEYLGFCGEYWFRKHIILDLPEVL